uniref:Putative coat protein n=1 Tax=Lichen partiti-like RNA virus sp. TaxID=2726938 RepID=A0A6J4CUM6_9VIRU|nr:putative coat protein [Lichen partiti-like RNA virus sp.]
MATNTTTALPIRSNAAAQRIGQRFQQANTLPDPAPQPSYHDDILDRMNAEQNISLDDGPTAIIDVQPDYRFTLSVIIYHVIRIYATLEQKNNPMISPASITAYCLALTYGYALICDSENVRNVKSEYADSYADNPSRCDLLIELERAFVPPFLRNILTALTPTFDPRRSNLSFVNTFACFFASHDYGRTYPISMFLKAHHIIATRPSNLNPVTTYNDWLQMNVTSGTPALDIGQLLGQGTQSGNYNNWISSRVQSLFNPVTSRSNTNRPTLAPIPSFPYPTTTWDINPYIYLLNADKDNIHTTLTFIKTMSNIVHEQITGSFQLGTHFSTQSGVQIMTHFYSGPSLPTWHSLITKPSDNDVTSTTFAETIKFLSTPIGKVETNLPFPEKDDIIDKMLYLVKKSTSHNNSDEPDSYMEFDSDTDVLPDVRYFDPYGYSPSTLPFTIMAGLHIETAEIDGFTIPQPNTDYSLRNENSHFLQSALPMHIIKPGNIIGNALDRTIIAERTLHDSGAPKVHVSLYDMMQNRIPYFDQQVRDSLPSTLPGFDATPHVGFFQRAFSSFGFRIPSLERSKPPNIHNDSIYAWSSYRYINRNVARTTTRRTRTYMICNFRTIYGTNITMSQSIHPSKLIPFA